MAQTDSDNILKTVKKALGITEYEFFDPDILMHINSVLSILVQIGIGPKDGFRCTEESVWADITEDNKLLECIKSYVFVKVKLLFDPPSSSTIIEAYVKQAAEYEWRMYITKDEERINKDKGVSL